MIVATTWWQSPRFPVDAALALRAQVLELGHEMHVFADSSLPWTLPLRHPGEYPGWWSKVELFRPDLADLRPMLFMDLDTFPMGGLSPLLELDSSQLWLINDFNRPEKGQTGLMVVPGDENLCQQIWEQSGGVARGTGEPDARLMRKFPHKRIQDAVDGIYSYKAHGLASAPPADARIVCFHGKPKPWDLQDGWVHDRFRKYASV